MKTILNNSVHFIAQPQSSIGKRYIAHLLKQYLAGRGDINYYSFQKKDIILWDKVFSSFFEQNRFSFIITVSSSCFTEFTKYLTENKFFESVKSSGRMLFNHYIFTPGRNGEDFKKTFNYILNALKNRSGNNVVWENDNLGTTIQNHTKGQYSKLKDFPEFQKIERRKYSTIHLPAETFCFQKDLSTHIRSGETFDQAIYDSGKNLIFRQRLYQLKNRYFGAIKNAGI